MLNYIIIMDKKHGYQILIKIDFTVNHYANVQKDNINCIQKKIMYSYIQKKIHNFGIYLNYY